MKAYEIGNQEGLQSLTLTERSWPSPGFGQVVLKVRSVCLNHRDLRVLMSTYGPRKPNHRIPVSDGVGEVIALGEGVAHIQLGQRVISPHFCGWLDGAFIPEYFGQDLGITQDGWMAEQVLVPASALVPVPDALSDEQVVALPAAALTAWNAIVEIGKVKSGDLLLTLGTGGVSIFALQIAKMHGARVAITSSSDEKLAMARNMGADITINYKTHPDWASAVLQASASVGHAGADIVVETGGIATLSQSIAAAAPNGRIALIGALAGSNVDLPNFSNILGKNLSVHGITSGSRSMLQALVRAAVANDLRPVINRKFSFAEAPAAYAYLKSGDHIGKVMIQIVGSKA